MKRVKMTMLAALALAALSACNIPLTSDYIYPMSMARAGPPISDEIRTAAPGEIILAQTVAHPGLLTLENQVTPAERVWQGLVTYYPRMEPGLSLYPALRTGETRRYVACSVDAVTTHQGGLGPDASFPVCLDLPDGAVLVVRPGQSAPTNATQIGGPLWLVDGAQANTGFVYWSAGGEHAQGSEGANFTLTEPARLRVSATESIASSDIRIALRYMADQSGSRLEAIYLTGEQQLRLTLAPVPIAASDTFPRVVQMGGAEVELLAIRDGVLAYRLRSNFPSDRLIISDLPG